MLYKKEAFSLIELLVVIAVIAILAAILFPVVTQAKESAKKAKCISNLKNLSIAMVLYVDDWSDTYPARIFWDSSIYNRYQVAWYGLVDTLPSPDHVDIKKSYLEPYLKNSEIKDCDSAKNFAKSRTFEQPFPIAYGANLNILINGVSGVKNIAEIEDLAETLLFADTAELGKDSSGNTFLRRAEFMTSAALCSSTVGYMHGRHPGGHTVIGWVDGHVKAMKVQTRPTECNPLYDSLTRCDLHKANLGLVLKYPWKLSGINIVGNYNYYWTLKKVRD